MSVTSQPELAISGDSCLKTDGCGQFGAGDCAPESSGCCCPYGECSCIPFLLPPQPPCINDEVVCTPIFNWIGIPVPTLPRCQDLLLPLCALPAVALPARPAFPAFPAVSAVPGFSFATGCRPTQPFAFPASFPPPLPPQPCSDNPDDGLPPCCPPPPAPAPSAPDIEIMELREPFIPLLPSELLQGDIVCGAQG